MKKKKQRVFHSIILWKRKNNSRETKINNLYEFLLKVERKNTNYNHTVCFKQTQKEQINEAVDRTEATIKSGKLKMSR